VDERLEIDHDLFSRKRGLSRSESVAGHFCTVYTARGEYRAMLSPVLCYLDTSGKVDAMSSNDKPAWLYLNSYQLLMNSRQPNTSLFTSL